MTDRTLENSSGGSLGSGGSVSDAGSGGDHERRDRAPGSGRSWPPVLLSAFLILALGGLCTFFWLEQRPEPLPVLGTIPEFRMRDQNASLFDSAALDGKIWVANFIFTACGAACPKMTKQMRMLQDRLKAVPELAEHVLLVSISVDPERDQPDVLARFARDYGADGTWWRFLTGSRDDAVLLSQKGFLLPAAGADPGGIPTHSDRFGLVDRRGRLRGHYRPIWEPGDLSRLFDDIRRLVEEEESASGSEAALP